MIYYYTKLTRKFVKRVNDISIIKAIVFKGVLIYIYIYIYACCITIITTLLLLLLLY